MRVDCFRAWILSCEHLSRVESEEEQTDSEDDEYMDDVELQRLTDTTKKPLRRESVSAEQVAGNTVCIPRKSYITVGYSKQESIDTVATSFKQQYLGKTAWSALAWQHHVICCLRSSLRTLPYYDRSRWKCCMGDLLQDTDGAMLAVLAISVSSGVRMADTIHAQIFHCTSEICLNYLYSCLQSTSRLERLDLLIATTESTARLPAMTSPEYATASAPNARHTRETAPISQCCSCETRTVQSASLNPSLHFRNRQS